MKNNVIKSFNILVITQFELLHNYYFDGPTKLFSDLYLTKFLNISAKSFFLYTRTQKDCLDKY